MIPFGEAATEDPRTIVITGVARGGTSFAASICSHLGIDMCRGGPRYENPFLQRAVVRGDWIATEQLVRTVARHLPVWGWKLPALIEHLDRIEALVPNPRFVFVIRNPIATLGRRDALADRRTSGQVLHRVLRHYDRVAAFCKRSSSPCLLFDYDQALRDVPYAVSALAQFCGVACADAKGVADEVAADAVRYRGGGDAKLASRTRRIGSAYDPKHLLYHELRAAAVAHGVLYPADKPAIIGSDHADTTT